MADRAVRHQHGDIDLVGQAAGEDFRGIDVDGDAVAAIGRRAEEARRDLADPPRGLRLQELRQRKPGAAVGRRGVLAVVADMRDAQIVLLRRVAVIDLVEFGAAIIRRARTLIALGRIIGRGRGDDGHARLRQRLFQRLERRVDIMRPAIGRGVADRGVVVAGPLHVGDRGIVVGRKAELVVERAGHGCVSPDARSFSRSSARLERVRLFLNSEHHARDLRRNEPPAGMRAATTARSADRAAANHRRRCLKPFHFATAGSLRFALAASAG